MGNIGWKDYGKHRWELLLNPLKYHWHLTMIPYAMTEVVYSLRFTWMLLRLVRSRMTT